MDKPGLHDHTGQCFVVDCGENFVKAGYMTSLLYTNVISSGDMMRVLEQHSKHGKIMPDRSIYRTNHSMYELENVLFVAKSPSSNDSYVWWSRQKAPMDGVELTDPRVFAIGEGKTFYEKALDEIRSRVGDPKILKVNRGYAPRGSDGRIPKEFGDGSLENLIGLISNQPDWGTFAEYIDDEKTEVSSIGSPCRLDYLAFNMFIDGHFKLKGDRFIAGSEYGQYAINCIADPMTG